MNTIPEDILGYILSFRWSPNHCLVCQRWCAQTHLKHLNLEEQDRLDLEEGECQSNLEEWLPVSIKVGCDSDWGLVRFFLEADELPVTVRLFIVLRQQKITDLLKRPLALLPRYDLAVVFCAVNKTTSGMPPSKMR
eukprot:RCo016995